MIVSSPYSWLHGHMDIWCYFNILNYIAIMNRYPLSVPHSNYLTVDDGSWSPLYRQLFANDQAHSTLHQRQSRLEKSHISLVIDEVIKQTSNRSTTKLYPRTGEIPSQAVMRCACSLCLLLVMTLYELFKGLLTHLTNWTADLWLIPSLETHFPVHRTWYKNGITCRFFQQT